MLVQAHKYTQQESQGIVPKLNKLVADLQGCFSLNFTWMLQLHSLSLDLNLVSVSWVTFAFIELFKLCFQKLNFFWDRLERGTLVLLFRCIKSELLGHLLQSLNCFFGTLRYLFILNFCQRFKQLDYLWKTLLHGYGLLESICILSYWCNIDSTKCSSK